MVIGHRVVVHLVIGRRVAVHPVIGHNRAAIGHKAAVGKVEVEVGDAFTHAAASAFSAQIRKP
jgi:hypothetical protein